MTLHRAFDSVSDPEAAIESALAYSLGCATLGFLIVAARAWVRNRYPITTETGRHCRHQIGVALRSAALYAAIPTTVDSDGAGRYPPDVESAVYFCCLEALQNAGKHAQARSIAILVSDGDDVLFEVRDEVARRAGERR